MLKMEKIATCIKETGNWSKLEREHRFDHANFSPESVADDIDAAAPKLKRLIENINRLDKEDLKTHGKKFKHFIYSDIKSAYGAKLIASALASHGFEHAYHLAKTSKGMSFQIKKNLEQYKGDVFATLTSVLFFEKPIGIRFRKELLGLYNKRPDNVNGEHIRIIILDSGFREGIDLFDVKYVHLFEPILTKADQKQAIGRATRFCGQKGLHFQKNVGWPIYVYKYETIVPVAVKHALLSQKTELAPAGTFFDLFMKFTNIDPKKITFANELEPLVIFGAVDRFLTRHVHNFSIEDLTQNHQYNEIFKSAGGNLTEFQKMQKHIREHFTKYTWPTTKIENGCLVAPAPMGAQQNGPSIIEFSPTQNFVRHYFTSTSKRKGLLLMHSVGTGKTCSAISVASTSFEKDDYTIIYVTRHTLKGDVWKNMFGQTCSVLIQEMVKKGIPIPEAEAKRQRLIKAWMEPMSYKQFSNMILGKNSLYTELVKRNGKHDILKKTLVIIDEAHKLNAPDVAGSEKPDVDAIKKALLHSYKVSGKDSAKLLIMTATPYTDDPIDMMKLLNLLRPENDQLPEIFEEFQKVYLDDDGKFTKEGRVRFLDDITGYVSYLNREKDVRSFSYPIVEEVNVPLSEYEFSKDLKTYIEQHNDVKQSQLLLGLLKSNLHQEKIEMHGKLHKELSQTMEKKQKEYQDCIQESKEKVKEALKHLQVEKDQAIAVCKGMQKECEKTKKDEYNKALQKVKDDNKARVLECKELVAPCKEHISNESAIEIESIKAKAKDALAKCKKGDTACKDAIKAKQAKDIAEVKAKAKSDTEKCKELTAECKEKLAEELHQNKEELKEDLKFDLKECNSEDKVKSCVNEANAEYQAKASAIKADETTCVTMKTGMIAYEKLQKELIQKQIETFTKEKQHQVDHDEDLLKKKQKTLTETTSRIVTSARDDRSQQMHLEHCLKTQKVKPHYQRVLKGILPDYIDEEGEVIDEAIPEDIKANVYLVNGHGSEEIKDFNKRITLPDDKVLVVFPVCGRPNWMNITCLFMDIFNNPKYIKWMSDPVKYKKAIEDLLGYPIRIYLPGDKVPFMSTNLFYNFDLAKTVVLKSGVFQLCGVPPINRERFPATTDMKLSLGNSACFKYTGVIDDASKYSGTVHHEVFKGNRYSKAGVREPYSKLVYRKFDVKDILEDTGPGIYYYTGCRSSHGKVSDDLYAKVLNQSADQQQKSHKSVVMNKFKEHLKIEKKDLSDVDETPELSPTKKTPSPKKTSPKSTDSSDKEETNNKKTLTKEEQKKVAADRKRYLAINKEVAELIHRFESIEGKEKDEVRDKCQGWKKELLEKKQPRIEGIDDLLVLLEGTIKPTLVLQFTKEKKHYTIYLSKEYKVSKRKYFIKDKEIGVLPLGGKSVQDKCSTETIVRRIKQLYKKNKLDKLQVPKFIEEYSDPGVFISLCKRSKQLVVA